MDNTSHTNFHPTALAAVNEALAVLGQDVVLEELSAASNVVHSRKAAFLYESSRRRVLRDHAWNFARRDLSVPPVLEDGEPPDCDGMRYRTAMPGRCARLVMCYGPDGRKAEYAVSGREIRSRAPVARIVYIHDEDNLDRWSPDAYRTLVLRLAADLAKPVTGRINERELQERAYAEQLAEAKVNDAREGNVPYDPYGENHYVEAMRGRRLDAPGGPFRR